MRNNHVADKVTQICLELDHDWVSPKELSCGDFWIEFDSVITEEVDKIILSINPTTHFHYCRPIVIFVFVKRIN